jgi:hypothetical protein
VTTPESAPFDLDRIVDSLGAHDVTYVVIGGTSGLLHGAVEHVTRDVDVLIRSDRNNRLCLAEALTDLGAVVRAAEACLGSLRARADADGH